MADLQSTNRVKTSRTRETVFGVLNSNPVWKPVRTTAPKVQPNIQTVVSDEIRSDRQVADNILVGQNASADMPGELSFNTYDDDLEEALQSAWVSQPSITVATSDTEISDVSATTLTVASGGAAFKVGHLTLISGMTTTANNKLARVSSSTGTTIVYPASTFTAQAVVNVGTAVRVVGFEGASADIVATISGGNALTSTTLDFTTVGLAAGDWVRIGDGNTGNSFATAGCNGWARVSAVAANRLSFDVVPAAWAADAGTGKAIRVYFGDRLRNGATKISAQFERQFLDHSPVTYEYETGATCDTFEISMSPKAIVKVGRSYKATVVTTQTSRVAGSTDLSATTTDVMNTSSNVGDLAVNGTTIAGPNFVTSYGISINNNLDYQDGIGSIGAVGIRNGEFNVSGDLTMYFGALTYYQMVLNNTTFGLNSRVLDASANKQGYVFDTPAVKFSAGEPQVDGKNQSVMFNGKYQAKMHSTLGYTLGVNRFWYTP